MSSQETKRQHYVPRTYLNKFSKERKAKEFQIYALKRSELSKSFPISTSKICVKNNMYTLQGETEHQRQIIEKFYGTQFENDYSKVYDIITDDSIKTIDDETRKLIIGTFITLLFRTAKLQNIHNSLINQIIEDEIQIGEQTKRNFINLAGEKLKIHGRTSKEIAKEFAEKGKETLIIMQLELALKLINIRKNDFVDVVKVDSEANLLTSDHPVILHNHGVKMIAPFDPNNLMSIPIDNKHRIDIYPGKGISNPNGIFRIEHEGIIAEGEIAVNNRCQYKNAETFILGDEDTLDGLEDMMKDSAFAKKITDAQREVIKKMMRKGHEGV